MAFQEAGVAVNRLIVAIVVVCLSVAWRAEAADDYAAMVARVKGGDVAIDYRALRDAFAASPGYAPYGGDFDAPRDAMRKAFNAKDCAKAAASAEKVLDLLYIDIMAHLLSGRCHELAGDQAKADFHRKVARGLLDSIIASGDGKTPKTAFIVVRIDEEYDVLSALRLKLTTQSLDSADGHAFDRMEVTSASGQQSVVFFEIDRPMTWLSKSMGK